MSQKRDLSKGWRGKGEGASWPCGSKECGQTDRQTLPKGLGRSWLSAGSFLVLPRVHVGY